MKRRRLDLTLATVAAGLLATGLSAQQHGAEPSRVVRLNRAPVNKEILRVHLPRPVETRLANGLTVLVLEEHKLPAVTFALWIKTGALADPKDVPGLAKFTAEMLREGTTHRTSAQVASDVDEIGATLAASADFGSSISSVFATGLSESADRLLDLVSDVVLNPTFPEDELAKYRTRELADLEQERSRPNFLASEKFHQVLYRTFPAAVASATPDSVKRATPEALRQFHDRYYAPNNAILCLVGDVKVDQAVALLKKYFGDWKNHPVRFLGCLGVELLAEIHDVQAVRAKRGTHRRRRRGFACGQLQLDSGLNLFCHVPASVSFQFRVLHGLSQFFDACEIQLYRRRAAKNRN